MSVWALKMIFSPIKNAVLIYKAINYQAFIAITHNISFSISFKSKTAPAITQMQKRLAFVPTLMFYTSRRLLKFLVIFHSRFLGEKPRQWNANLCYVVCSNKQKRGLPLHFQIFHLWPRCSGAYRSIFTAREATLKCLRSATPPCSTQDQHRLNFQATLLLVCGSSRRSDRPKPQVKLTRHPVNFTMHGHLIVNKDR